MLLYRNQFQCTLSTHIATPSLGLPRPLAHLQVPFLRRVLYNGHHQLVMVAEVRLVTPPSYPLDHFLVGDAELVSRIQQGCHDSSLGVSVDHSPSV